MPRGRLAILLIIACVVAFLAAAETIRADSVTPPYSYTKPSAGGRFLFVMIAPGTVEEDVRRWNEETAAKIVAIRDTYPRSGLYRNDGSTTPLWTVDWYAYDVEVASDGVHLVRRGRWSQRTDQEAFSFFANGRLVRTYAISYLVDVEFLLPHSVSHIFWSDSARLDDATRRYVVSTKDGNSFVFDVTTGNIVEETRNARLKVWAGVVTIVLLAGAAITFAVRHRRMQNTSRRGTA